MQARHRPLSGTDRSAAGGDSYFPTLTPDQDEHEHLMPARKPPHTERQPATRPGAQEQKTKMLEQLRGAAKKGLSDPGGQGHLFSKLARLVDETHPRSTQIADIQRKISRKRSRIKRVQTKSQQSLWGKNGGYQPAQIYQEEEEGEQ